MSEHSDEQERLRIDRARFALGGASDDATREIERRIREGDDELEREVAALRLASEVVRADAAHEPSAGVMEQLRAMAQARAPTFPPENQWLIAVPVGTPAGVRGPLPKDGVLSLQTDELRLTVTLAPSALQPGLAATGQLTREDGSPFDGVALTLFVDLEESGSTTSDELGEFAFEAVEGNEFMLRLEAGYGPHFVLLRRGDDA